MIDKKLVENYKKLEKYDKEHLFYYITVKYCYDYEASISDEMVTVISNKAYECWLDDNDSKDINDYTGYILDSVYEYGATLEQIQELDSDYVIKCYDNGKNAGEILKLDTEDLEYGFTDNNNHKYYLTDDGFYEVDEKGIKIKDPHPMENPFYDFLEMIKNNKIKDISTSMHYNIRCAILDNENDLHKEDYEESLESYRKYCEEHFINSKTILSEVKLNIDIDLFDLDKLDIEEFKMKKLYKIFNDNNLEISNNYSYSFSLNNGNDYYYDKKLDNYILINKDNEIKYFENESFFILKEIYNNEKIDYISSDEVRKVLKFMYLPELKENVNDIVHIKTSALNEFNEYVNKNNSKELEEIENLYNTQRMEYLHKVSNNFVSSIFDDEPSSNKKQEKDNSYDNDR